MVVKIEISLEVHSLKPDRKTANGRTEVSRSESLSLHLRRFLREAATGDQHNTCKNQETSEDLEQFKAFFQEENGYDRGINRYQI